MLRGLDPKAIKPNLLDMPIEEPMFFQGGLPLPPKEYESS